MEDKSPVISHYFVILAGIALLLAVLACNAPTWDEVKSPLNLPTADPTEAPSPEPGEIAPVGESFILNEVGIKITYAASGDVSCPVEAPMTLTVRSDGTAELGSTSLLIQDHYNCTAGETEETWIVAGTFNPDDRSVNSISCNYGGFTAQGTLLLDGNGFTGEVSCFTKDGMKSVTLRADE